MTATFGILFGITMSHTWEPHLRRALRNMDGATTEAVDRTAPCVVTVYVRTMKDARTLEDATRKALAFDGWMEVTEADDEDDLPPPRINNA